MNVCGGVPSPHYPPLPVRWREGGRVAIALYFNGRKQRLARQW